jgi:protein-tyrosine kinase
MNTIEQAAKRLEQLRNAGVDVPGVPAAAPSLPAPEAKQAEASPEVPQTNRGLQTSSQAALDVALADTDLRSKEVTLDLLRMSRAGLLVPGAPRSRQEEEFRLIKRPLLENVRGQTAVRPHRANLIMVTSALPGEGKTQTAINLAVSIAMELDHTVLLVEADVLKPSALSRMGVNAGKGLVDMLENPSRNLAEVLLKTNIPKLTLLPAGSPSSRATELLASDAMNALLEELASKYSDRVIIFDSPPLLQTTESRVLASHMGQVVMVVEAAKTPISTVRQAYAAVEEHPVVLSMLNKHQGAKSGDVYGYYVP